MALAYSRLRAAALAFLPPVVRPPLRPICDAVRTLLIAPEYTLERSSYKRLVSLLSARHVILHSAGWWGHTRSVIRCNGWRPGTSGLSPLQGRKMTDAEESLLLKTAQITMTAREVLSSTLTALAACAAAQRQRTARIAALVEEVRRLADDNKTLRMDLRRLGAGR